MSKNKEKSSRTKKQTKKRKKKVSFLQVKSKKTGHVHTFIDTAAFEKLAKDLTRNFSGNLKSTLLRVLPFWSWLNKEAFKQEPDYVLDHSLFKIYPKSFDPISISGSLADGGRFNIGGAQQILGFNPPIHKEGCVYAASSLDCAKAEIPFSNAFDRKYEIKSQSRLDLWDLEKVLVKLGYPGPEDSIGSLPLGAAWGLQKCPTESQLLAHFLRKKGGDGIVSKSAKFQKGKVFALFFRTDQETHKNLTVIGR